jgi:hypothetical protein
MTMLLVRQRLEHGVSENNQKQRYCNDFDKAVTLREQPLRQPRYADDELRMGRTTIPARQPARLSRPTQKAGARRASPNIRSGWLMSAGGGFQSGWMRYLRARFDRALAAP